MPNIVNVGSAQNDGTGDDFRTAFQKINANGRLKLTAATNFYVDGALGSDTNDGLAAGAGAFATIQKAVDTIANDYDLAGFTPTINIADGTYAESVQLQAVTGDGGVAILGNIATPANVLIQPVTGDCFHRNFYTDGHRVPYLIRGLKVVAPAGRQGFWIRSPAYVQLRDIDFGACAHHVIADSPGATVVINGAYTVSGNGDVHLWARYGALIYLEGTFTVTFVGTRAWTVYGWYASGQSQISSNSATITNTGTITGTRHRAEENSLITKTGNAPGSIAGGIATGGVTTA